MQKNGGLPPEWLGADGGLGRVPPFGRNDGKGPSSLVDVINIKYNNIN